MIFYLIDNENPKRCDYRINTFKKLTIEQKMAIIGFANLSFID